MTEIVHGGIDYSELTRLGIAPADVIDFSVNGNPYGPSPRTWDALRHVDIAHYPDRHCLALRHAILAYDLPHSGLMLDHLLCGNGTAELIWAVARAFLTLGMKTAIVGPTFGEYAPACASVGARVIEIRPKSPALTLDTSAVVKQLQQERPALVWLCNPNNPTGSYRDEADQRWIIAVCAEIGATLVIDEAYSRFLIDTIPFSATALIGTTSALNVIVLRSLTKDYALAGLRLGYAVSAPDLIDRMAAHLPSWSVNAAAQVVGVAAIEDQQHLARTLAQLADERARYFAALREIGCSVAPSSTHFCLIDVGDARATRQHLLTHGLLVRDCTSFGLPHCIRTVTRPEWPQLIAALNDVRPPPILVNRGHRESTTA